MTKYILLNKFITSHIPRLASISGQLITMHNCTIWIFDQYVASVKKNEKYDKEIFYFLAKRLTHKNRQKALSHHVN